MIQRWLAVVVGLMWCAVARGEAQDEIFQAPQAAYTAPGGIFSVAAPAGWVPSTAAKTPDLVVFQPPGDASLVVRRISVPKGAKPRQLMLKAIEDGLRKLPDFQLMQRQDTTVGTFPAALATGTYSYQKNVAFPRVVEEVYVVAGTDAFIMRFDAAQPVQPELIQELQLFYRNFQPRPAAGAEQGPFAPGPDPIDVIPF